MLRLAAAAALLLAFSAPALADTADDVRNCNGGQALRVDRIAACTRLIEAGEGDASDIARYEQRRGALLTAEGQYDAALADFNAALDDNPSNWNAHASRAVVYLYLGRPEDAVADLDAALEALPRLGYAYYYRGLAEAALGETDAALADYGQAMSIDANLAWIVVDRGSLFLAEGRVDDARAEFEASIATDPLEARAYAGLGRIADAEGNAAEAIRNFRLAQLLDANLAAPNERLPELVAAATAADQGPLVFAAPAEGLRIQYAEVDHGTTPPDETPAADVGDVLNWYAGRPTAPIPDEAAMTQWTLGATGDDAVTVTAVTTLTGNADLVDAPGTYDHLLMPIASPSEFNPGLYYVYRGLDRLWQLGPGETATGDGRLMAVCPEDTDPVMEGRGCQPNVPAIRAGTFEWTATFVGWEYVLVPAGYRLTARIQYDAETHFGFEQVTDREEHITLWYDPEIHWWVKRERTRNGVVQTFEAVTIEQPRP
jgi:tetratricopeptide (TPR) repeat protein